MRRKLIIAAIAALTGPVSAHEPYVGQVIFMAADFCPQGWVKADGQLLGAAADPGLLQVIGGAYGGDGVNTFALPDLRGRSAVHAGRGPGLTEVGRGDRLGAETVTLNEDQTPPHSHSLPALRPLPETAEDDPEPSTARTRFRKPGDAVNLPGAAVLAAIAPGAEGEATTPASRTAGSGAPVPIRAPALVLTACIAIEGQIPQGY